MELILKIIGGVIVAVTLYEIFISDYISEKLDDYRTNKDKYLNANRVAKVKVFSDNVSDIEKFIISSGHYLSEEMVQQLINRIESLQADKALFNDPLKARIDALDKSEVVQQATAQTKGKQNA